MQYKESMSDEGKGEKVSSRKWKVELDKAEKLSESWRKRVKDIGRRYLNRVSEGLDFNETRRQFNILWSNINTLQPTLYSRTPKPQVERKFKDSDPIGRTACQILERYLETNIGMQDFDYVMKRVRDDYLLAGRGVARIYYKPKFGKVQEQLSVVQGRDGSFYLQDGSPLPGRLVSVEQLPGGAFATVEYEKLVDEKICYEHVHWSDFYTNPARSWSEVHWVGFRSFLSRKEAEERFGKEVASQLDYSDSVLDDNDKDTEAKETENFKKVAVYEVWCKDDKKVYWIAKGQEQCLDVQDDPYKLTNFFPVARPLYSTVHDSLIPTPDFDQYEVEVKILDECTRRRAKLIAALRRRAIYDPNSIDLERLTNELDEAEWLPAKDWPGFMQKGGFEGILQYLPISEIVEGIQQCDAAFEASVQRIYQITGLSDIVRGNTSPSETATAQQIKGQFATLRIADKQSEVQRLAEELFKLDADAALELLQPETIYQMAGIDFLAQNDPSVLENWQAALELLKNDKLRTFRVKIATDSTLAIDEQRERQERTEFLQAIGGFIGQTQQMVQADPSFAPLMYELLTFGARSFKVGRNLENYLEQAIEQSKQAAQQPPPEPPPDPELMKLEHQKMVDQAKIEIEQTKTINEAKALDQKAMLEAQIEQLKIQLQAQKVDAEMQIKWAQAQAQQQLETIKVLQEQRESQKEQQPIIINTGGGTKVAKFQTDPVTGERMAVVQEVIQPSL